MKKWKDFFTQEKKVAQIISAVIIFSTLALIFGPGALASFTRTTGSSGWGYGYGYGYGSGYGDGGASYRTTGADLTTYAYGFGYGSRIIQLTIADPTLTLSKVEDGTLPAAVTAGALSGVVDPDVVTVSAVATYDTAAVGTGKTITVVYTLAGANAAGYITPVNYSVSTGIITSNSSGGSGSSGGSSGTTPATPATPAVPGVSPAIPATPATPAYPPQSCRDKITNAKYGKDVAKIATALHLGSRGTTVKSLQQFLNNNGFAVAKKGAAGSIGKETTLFGSATKAALIKFQKAKNIRPADGTVNAATRAYFKSNYGTYANGSFLRGCDGGIYILKAGKKVHIKSMAELKKYKKVVLNQVSNEVLRQYPNQ